MHVDHRFLTTQHKAVFTYIQSYCPEADGHSLDQQPAGPPSLSCSAHSRTASLIWNM